MAKHTFKIVRCKHRKIFKVRWAVFQHHAGKGKLFYDGSRYHIEISPLIYRENQWNGFSMIGTSVMKELKTQEYKIDNFHAHLSQCKI